jgi:phosphatidylinositol dimannoside acyltransferase
MYGTAAWLAARLPGPTGRVLAERAAAVFAHSPTAATQRRRRLVASHLRRVYASSQGPDPLDSSYLGSAPDGRSYLGRALDGRSYLGRALDERSSLGRALDERSSLGRAIDDTFASYARYWAESLRLPSIRPAELSSRMSSDGFEHLFSAWAGGRGVILALPHLGGWEWGGAWLAAQGVPVSVVVEALQPAALFDWFVSFRRSLGLEVIAAGAGAGSAALRALHTGRVLCLLCDRLVGGGPGVEAGFFGERTLLPAGPVTLAFRSGAPLLSAAVYFAPGRPDHLAVVRPPLVLERAGRLRDDVERETRVLAGELEALIRRAPTQWHLMQPNWPSDPGWSGQATSTLTLR